MCDAKLLDNEARWQRDADNERSIVLQRVIISSVAHLSYFADMHMWGTMNYLDQHCNCVPVIDDGASVATYQQKIPPSEQYRDVAELPQLPAVSDAAGTAEAEARGDEVPQQQHRKGSMRVLRRVGRREGSGADDVREDDVVAAVDAEPKAQRKSWMFNRGNKKIKDEEIPNAAKSKTKLPKEQTFWWQLSHSSMKLPEGDTKKGLFRGSSDDVSRELQADASFSTNGAFSLLHDTHQRKSVFHHFGMDPFDVLAVEESDVIPQPPTPNHVVVKVQASTVTLQDCLNRRGYCLDMLNPVCLPSTPGCDVVGYIMLAGTGVESFGLGDRVAALVRTGGNARYAAVHKDSLVKVPNTLSSIEVACMMTVYATAYQCLKVMSENNAMFSLKGKRVLVVGGMDGVGQALIQLCKKGRADVHATAPERRHGYVRNVLGATPLPESVKAWSIFTEGEYDMVFDGVCEDTLDSSRKALKDGGKVVCFGYSSMLREDGMGLFGAPISAYLKKLQTASETVDIWDCFQHDPEQYKKNVQALFQLLKWHKIKPHIAKRVTLSQIANAQAKLETGEVRGTVVCLPWRRVNHKEITKTEAETNAGAQ